MSALLLAAVLLVPPLDRGYAGPSAALNGDADGVAPGEAAPAPEPAPEPTPEPEAEDPVDLDALGEIEEEEIGGPGDEGEPGEVRTIEVTTDLLGGGQRADVFRHAGGRALVEAEEVKDRGIASVGEALDRLPGVRAVEGNAGIGSTSTKLNVGVRGANPRLSSEATVMLDEVPIAPAPYGQPQLSLFPLSIFSIATIDAVRGGSSVRFGPRTSGGVFNLISNPIPKDPRIAIFAQSDHFGDAGVATSYGGTHRGVGMYFEYAPRFGRTYREHSEFQAHAGIVKLAYSPRSNVDLSSTTHLFSEDSNLPGGLDEKQYVEGNRFRSVRPYDRFEGWRVGSNFKVRWRPREDHELQTILFYSHSYRMSVLERQRGVENDPPALFYRPRGYDAMGIEPRYALRLRHEAGPFHDLTLGGRFMYEIGRSRECREWATSVSPNIFPNALGDLCFALPLEAGDPDDRIRRDGDARIAAYALYVDDQLYLLDASLVITAGARLEIAQLGGRNNLSQRALNRSYWEVLPAASIRYEPVDELSLYVGYGRSFGPSQFLQVDTATSDTNFQLNPEMADMVEAGIKVLELGGVYGEVSGWYRNYRDLTDIGETQVDRIPAANVYGVEAEVEWEPGEVWEKIEGLNLTAGYAWTGSKITRGQYTGNRLAWYPAHEVWGSLSYELPWGLGFGSDVSYNSWQFSDYANKPEGFDASGATGRIPAYTLVGAFARLRAPLPDHWQLEVTFGVKNLANQEWFMRTDDENRGILAMRPRTFYFSIGFAHDFVGRRGDRAKRRREAHRPNVDLALRHGGRARRMGRGPGWMAGPMGGRL